MINTNYNSSFPDQVVPDSVKNSYDYGIQVGRASGVIGIYKTFKTIID